MTDFFAIDSPSSIVAVLHKKVGSMVDRAAIR